jgi:hypothetical protein
MTEFYPVLRAGTCLANYRYNQFTMKHLYLTIALALTVATSFSQSFYVITAKKSGNWSDASTWNSIVRLDNKKVNTYVIPQNTTVTLSEDRDMTSNDIELEVSGVLELRSDNSLLLTDNSIINVMPGGVITLHANAMNQANDKKIEQILIGGIVKFDGNVQTQITGPASASKSTGLAPTGFSSNAMLPVNFVSFTAGKSAEDVIALTWTTTDEINNSHFEIQRSTDGTNFKSIAIVLPANDNNNIHEYRYNDRFTAKGVVYYRIRQVDNDGKEKFSTIKVLNTMKVENNTAIYVSGNKSIVVDLKNVEGKVIVRVVSLTGSIISQLSTTAADQKITINAYNASAGAYVVQVSDSKGFFNSKKVML